MPKLKVSDVETLERILAELPAHSEAFLVGHVLPEAWVKEVRNLVVYDLRRRPGGAAALARDLCKPLGRANLELARARLLGADRVSVRQLRRLLGGG